MEPTQGLPTQSALTPERRKDLTEVRIFMTQLLQKL